MADGQEVVAGRESLDLLCGLESSPQSETPAIIKEWSVLEYDDTALQSLPTFIDRCSNVKKISAARNSLSSLPQSIFSMPHLTILDISDNAFRKLPVALCNMANLQKLYLDYNFLSNMPVEIRGMTRLRILSLSNNDFSTFPIALCQMIQLEELLLDYNSLSDIPNEISEMIGLTKFSLSNNNFSTFPKALCRMIQLEELLLDHNHLSDIPDIISEMKGLKKFSLGSNNFETFPRELCLMVYLEKLYMNDNKVSDIPEEIRHMKGLKLFSLSNNCFHNFPKTLCDMTNLKELYLKNNRLSKIPNEFNRNIGLRLFWLGSNLFHTFPKVLCGMANLEELHMDNNRLSDIPQDINIMTGLKVFWLYGNDFSTIPIALCRLDKLKELHMDHNKLSEVPDDINKMLGLRKFSLCNNRLTTFPTVLYGMTEIETLLLANNQISDIAGDISTMTGLKYLNLESNQITHLPLDLMKLDNLEELDLENNPLVQPPEHIADKGLDAVKRYFEALTTTPAILSNRIQVNLLGETESGKTSLSRTLQRGKSTLTTSADRTRVVEQGTWQPHHDISFNINDFGEHGIYNIGHTIFISKRGLVLITFDVSKYDPGNEIHYHLYIGNWIDKVQAQRPGIKMALVGTHIDEDEAHSAKWSFIKSKLEYHRQMKQKWYESQIKNIEKKMLNIDGSQSSILQAYEDKKSKLMALQDQVINIHDDIFQVSSKTMKGIEELQNYLTTVARECAVILPEMWVDAATMVCTKKYEGSENTLGWDQLQDLILQSAPTPWKKMSSNEHLDLATCDILSFLADHGDIIWFDSSPTLRKVVFHRQEVLANVLKTVLNYDTGLSNQLRPLSILGPRAKKIHDDIFSRGIISREAIDLLWEPFRLSSTEVDVIVELMQKLELCYEVQEDPSVPSSISFHFPWLLTEKRQPELDTKWPSKVPPDTTQLTLQVLFPYRCPEGIFEKLSVRQYKHLGLWKTKRIDWQDGVYAELQGSQMQITRQERHQQLDTDISATDSIITIAIRGSRPKLSEMWSVLSRAHGDLMAIIKEDWPGASYDKFLVCPHCVNEHPALFPSEAQNEPLPTAQDPELVPSTIRLGETAPTLFPGEILDLTHLPGGVSKPRHVPCVNTGVYIPTDLVYPPHLTMSWQEVVKKNKNKLKQNITEPCLFNLINVFIQESILSDRESEWIMTSPDNTAVFLDFLTTKPSRAFDILCQFFVEHERYDLLELMKN